MSKLRSILAEILRISEGDVSDDIAIHANPSWNSLTHIELILMIEEAFKIQLTEDEIVAMRSVGEIRKILQKRSVRDE